MTRRTSRPRADARLRPIATAIALVAGGAVWSSGRAEGAPVVPTVQFEALRSYGSTVSSRLPDLGDFDGDGRSEPLGSLQRADGSFATIDGSSMGLGAADQLGAADHLKTFRIADFSGDGRDDVLAVPYAPCTGDTTAKALLFVNQGNNRFVEDTGFSSLSAIRGLGETAIATDFDNDGRLDLFIPFYNRPDDPVACAAFGSTAFAPTNRLLRNISSGGVTRFTDVTAGSGLTVAVDATDATGAIIGPAEGAHAADIDGDGLVDLLVGQRLYRNRGGLRFDDITVVSGLPAPSWENFEEGAAFVDWNADGRLDIVLNTQNAGGSLANGQMTGRIRLYGQQPTCANGVACFAEIHTAADGTPVFSSGANGSQNAATTCQSFGMWPADLDNDGFQDLILAGTTQGSRTMCGTSAHAWRVYFNLAGQGSGFREAAANVSFRERLSTGSLGTNISFGGSPHIAIGDLDQDNRVDVVVYGGRSDGTDYSRYIGLNRTPNIAHAFRVTLLDPSGHRTLQGRVLRTRKAGSASGPIVTRVVDGGSGYLTNGTYSTLIGVPDTGQYQVQVVLPNASTGQPVTVTATASSGAVVTITQPDAGHPAGQVSVVGGTSPAPTTTSVAPGPETPAQYVGLVPARLLDTRPEASIGYSGSKPAAGQVVGVPVGAALPGVAIGAAVLNLTGTDADGGYVTAWPCDQPLPNTSSLNLAPGGTAANLVITKLAGDGTVCLYTEHPTHLVVDIEGYIPAAASYVAVQPERLLDTRSEVQLGYSGDRPFAGDVVTLWATGVGVTQVPASAKAIVLNVTGADADGGYVTVWPCDQARPNASNLNLSSGAARPNLVVVKPSWYGTVCLFTEQAANLIADVVGYYPADAAVSVSQPTRVLDTRAGGPIGYSGDRPTAGSVTRATVVGPGLAPVGTRFVYVNLTAADADGGYLTVFPCDVAVPNASNLNVPRGDTRPNLVLATVVGSEICIFTEQATDIIADLDGWLDA